LALKFRAMLNGFHQMDETFPALPLFERNLPYSWDCWVFGTTTSLITDPLRFFRMNKYLKRFPAYLQQLTMESNGKHVTLTGPSTYQTGANLLGESGTNGSILFTR